MAQSQFRYKELSYKKAFGQYDPDDWDPDKGFAPNKSRIQKLYDYYRDTYNARPDLFLWAGLGRMAGGAVLGGLTQFIGMFSESLFSQKMVEIGKKIFEDLAWQHEAVLDDETNALKLAEEWDAAHPAKRKYKEAWTRILSGDQGIAEGNKMLLENEQFTIVQPRYDEIARSSDGGWLGVFRQISAFTGKIHPYHRDFLLTVPKGNVTRADDRWSWIAQTGGMWEKWAERRGSPAVPVVMSKVERARLVSLPMNKIIAHDFEPLDESLRLPGTPDI